MHLLKKAIFTVIFISGCSSSVTGASPSRTVTVPANNSTACSFFDTGLDVDSGTTMEITAGGTWLLAAGAPENDANGIPGNVAANGIEYGTLVGKIGDGPLFKVGSPFSQKSASKGRLYLAANDVNCEDNQGNLKVTINLK
jgi:hypothetical protein